MTAIRVLYILGVLTVSAGAVLLSTYLEDGGSARLWVAIALLVIGLGSMFMVRFRYGRTDPAERRSVTGGPGRTATIGFILAVAVAVLGGLGLWAALAAGGSAISIVVALAIIALAIWTLARAWGSYQRDAGRDPAQ